MVRNWKTIRDFTVDCIFEGTACVHSEPDNQIQRNEVELVKTLLARQDKIDLATAKLVKACEIKMELDNLGLHDPGHQRQRADATLALKAALAELKEAQK